MEINELYTKVSDQNFTLKRVLANSSAPGSTIEQTKNILYNNIDEIEAALKYAAGAEEKISLLELELSDAERELDEKDRQLKDAAAKKTTGKKKPAEAVDG